MDVWWQVDEARLLQEHDAVCTLVRGTDWCTDIHWSVVEKHLCCSANIKAHGHIYRIRMTYPAFFPELPPYVQPVDDSRRWSGHQYGAGGTLCLEWGPDNWRTDIIGAQLLESTHQLLLMENPLGEPEIRAQPVPSRDQQTLAMQLDRSAFKGLISEEMRRRLAELPLWAPVRLENVLPNLSEVIFTTALLNDQGESSWRDSSLPASFNASSGTMISGFFLRTDMTSESVERIKTLGALSALLKTIRLSFWPHAPCTPLERHQQTSYVIIVDRDNKMHTHLFTPDEKTRFVQIPDDRFLPRQNHQSEQFAGKTVGIVGLGSLGSKVALTLARAGLPNFLLLDEDVLLPGNLVRHTLDWLSVGILKVAAVANQLRNVAPGVDVETFPLNVHGQLSARLQDVAVSRLALCDVIIDATANPDAFTLLNAVSVHAKKPLVWGQVYGGGLGGLVARSRPGLDPSPLQMNAAYREFCTEHPLEATQTPLEAPSIPYAQADEEGTSWQATDADVGVIAHHLGQLVLDLLLEQQSRFPAAMYLLGFKSGWIFSQPFENRAIEMPEAEVWNEAQPENANLTEDERQRLLAFQSEIQLNSGTLV